MTAAKNEEPELTMQQRWAGMYTVILMLLLMAFFVMHQWKGSGFFTDKFGWPEMIALYVPMIISLGAPIQRLVQGKRNPPRLLDAISDISLAMGSLWLWNHFPFDFAHLADIFPQTMRFAFAWIKDNVGRFILLMQIAIGFLSGVGILLTYYRERKETEVKTGE